LAPYTLSLHDALPICLSISSTRCQVVLAWSEANGVDLPQPRWSNTKILYFSGLNWRRCFGLDPPPGPPWRNTTGLPSGLPDNSQDRKSTRLNSSHVKI